LALRHVLGVRSWPSRGQSGAKAQHESEHDKRGLRTRRTSSRAECQETARSACSVRRQCRECGAWIAADVKGRGSSRRMNMEASRWSKPGRPPQSSAR
jgi:hypothetical protein